MVSPSKFLTKVVNATYQARLLSALCMLENDLNNTCINISGLPGSGKTTIAKRLREELGLPLLDKDVFLEELFEERGVGGIDWRKSLSREADSKFIAVARSFNNVILVSHWRPLIGGVDFGTPSDWIVKNFKNVIELNVVCSIEKSAERFRDRVRHSGHVDDSKSLSQVIDMLRSYGQYLPLGVGKLVQIDTNDDWIDSFQGVVNAINKKT